MAEDRNSAQEANKRVEKMVHSKQLSLNKEKSTYMVFGNQKARKKLNKQIKDDPIMLDGKVMVEAKQIKYLGDFLTNDLSDSVHQTVMKRIGLAKKTILEIRSVIEDTVASKKDL